ncbi:MAG: hypothetical protein AB3N28_09435 [Kordiimonas sp.]
MKLNLKSLRHLALAGFLSLAPSTVNAAKQIDHDPLAVIPIEIINNRILVSLPVGPYDVRLTLDTGASNTALFQSRHEDFGDLSQRGNADIIFPALDEIVEGVTVEPVPIKLGNHNYIPSRLLTVGRRPPIGDRLNFKFDGVLGQDFFNQFVVEIDREVLELRLYPAGTDLSDYFRTKLKLEMKGSAPYIKLHNKMPWEDYPRVKSLMLDTGYPGAMVLWGKKHFVLAAKGDDIDALRADNKGIFTTANFRVGTLRFYQTPIFVSPNQPMQAQERDGIIGSNVIVWFHHVIDFPGKQLLLNTGRVHFNRMDGIYYLPNHEGFIVKRFTPKPVAGSIYVLGN